MKTIKRSIITRGVEDYSINEKITKTYLPKMGDVAVFEIISIGKHKSVQGIRGINQSIFPGDKILATFGNRYASNQFEGYVPTEHQETYQILGQGGVIGVLKSMHVKFDDIGATEVKLVGYAVDENNTVINTKYYNLEKEEFVAEEVAKNPAKVYLSVGASMDSGKTTTAGYLSRGLMLEGKNVAYIKLTGTVYSRDAGFVSNCGAMISADFSHCGYPATYMCSTKEILDIYSTLMKKVQVANPDVVVVEIADGLLQKETYNLLKNESFMKTVEGIVLSCPDSLSVFGGLEILKGLNTKPVIISGLFTASPLMINEVEAITDIPVFNLEDFLIEDKLVNVLSIEETEMLYV